MRVGIRPGPAHRAIRPRSVADIGPFGHRRKPPEAPITGARHAASSSRPRSVADIGPFGHRLKAARGAHNWGPSRRIIESRKLLAGAATGGAAAAG